MTTDATASPFDDSRRLTGPNLYFADTGAALETGIGTPIPAEVLDTWRQGIEQARAALSWPDGEIVTRHHDTGVSLAFAAPFDQLYAATDVNEWAWLASLREHRRLAPDQVPFAPGHPAVWDQAQALHTLAAAARSEHNPALTAMADAARAHDLPFLSDDDAASIGLGTGSHTWPVDSLPALAQIDWRALHAIPTALVTGSNGKTTTVRLLSSIWRRNDRHAVHSCTDGLYLDGELLEGGDYSGPAGARTVLRNPLADVAILETARGGLLRRGLALQRADVAVVTNVQPDHFGEYGIHDLDDLTQVKLTVARALDATGTLVVNADDAQLRRHAPALPCSLAWFAPDYDDAFVARQRERGIATCGVREGRLTVSREGREQDLGEVTAMPITFAGSARHNIANIAAAALAALHMGVQADVIASALARFGGDRRDNPGRLQRWALGDVVALLDYAHNPDGLSHLLTLAGNDVRGDGGIRLLLGQAGNRGDADIADLAAVAARFEPALIVLKDIEGFERGRGEGEVPAILHTALAAHGVPAGRIAIELDETAAVHRLLRSARPGDVLVLPVHGTTGRARTDALLAALADQDWHAGQPLPPINDHAPP